jgi:type III restriction enzyme
VAPHSNRVMARWIVRREMKSLFPRAVAAVQWDDPRFDAPVEITSRAAQVLREDGEKLVDAFLEGSRPVFEEGNPYTVGALYVNPAKAHAFSNALHDEYDLNDLEQLVANELDLTGYPWTRNPQHGGFNIPLLDKGGTQRFFPDFLVWKDGVVFAVDPKGGYLLKGDAGRKLLNIMDEKKNRNVLVRFIVKGRQNDQMLETSKSGFTIWSAVKTTGNPKAKHVATMTDAVEVALKT